MGYEAAAKRKDMNVVDTARELRDAFGHFPTGVVVVTAVCMNGDRIGMTVSSFNTVSVDPPLVLFSISKNAIAFSEWHQARSFAVNVLSSEQEEISNRFARSKTPKWADIADRRTPSGLPQLADALVTFECETYHRYEGGDHEIIVGRVTGFHLGDRPNIAPLVFCQGKYRKLAPVAHAPPPEADLYGWVSDLHGL